MNTDRRELLEVLKDARAFLALPGNDFVYSHWENAGQALREMDTFIATIEAGVLPARLDLAVLFAPTGSIQEVSIASGWAQQYLALASRFDAAEKGVFAEPAASAAGGRDAGSSE